MVQEKRKKCATRCIPRHAKYVYDGVWPLTKKQRAGKGIGLHALLAQYFWLGEGTSRVTYKGGVGGKEQNAQLKPEYSECEKRFRAP